MPGIPLAVPGIPLAVPGILLAVPGIPLQVPGIPLAVHEDSFSTFSSHDFSFSLLVMKTFKLYHTFITPLRSKKVNGLNLITAYPPQKHVRFPVSP